MSSIGGTFGSPRKRHREICVFFFVQNLVLVFVYFECNFVFFLVTPPEICCATHNAHIVYVPNSGPGLTLNLASKLAVFAITSDRGLPTNLGGSNFVVWLGDPLEI